MSAVWPRGTSSDRYLWFMKKQLIILLFLSPQILLGQFLYEHRGVQYATHGTDFWFCMPAALHDFTDYNDHPCLYFMAEHDCYVTISNPLIDYSYTHFVRSCHRINSRLDTLNLVEFNSGFIEFLDRLEPGIPNDQQRAAQPQVKGFHITSTDTISVFLLAYTPPMRASSDVTNLLPTELLRDEYVVQVYQGNQGMFEVVATEDSTVVDIVLSDVDWIGRPKDSVVTVTLNQGMMYNVKVGEKCAKYPECCSSNPPAGCGDTAELGPHSFSVPTSGSRFNHDSMAVDLSGTYIKARDHKRIAVFQGSQLGRVGEGMPRGTDLMYEQAMPIRYAGKEFLIPNLMASMYDYIQFTGLVDSTDITITNTAAASLPTRTLHVDARETDWFLMDTTEGPFYVTSTQPVLTTVFSSSMHHERNYPAVDTSERGDPAMLAVRPVEWWHSGPVNGSQVFWVDENNNGYSYHQSTHIFTRTTDVRGMFYDGYDLFSLFRPVAGTPYSYALIRYDSDLAYRRAHRIVNTLGGTFWVVSDSEEINTHTLFSYAPLQRGKNYLMVNDIPADSFPSDSVMCLYDPIRFHGWVERPADSIIWDFGDGHVERYLYENGQNVTHLYADTGRYEVLRIIQYKDEALDTQWGYVGCKSAFSRPPDTMRVEVWLHNHYDSTFFDTLCEGDYLFRGREFSFTGEYEVTTYWTPSGCDTLWHINLTICPHCIEYNDTVREDRLPWKFNGLSFNDDIRYYPIHIDIGEECDSVIFYSLYVIRKEDFPPDGTFVLAPNVISPMGNNDVDRKFRLFCSKDIERAEVVVFDRMGRKVAEFDGLTGEWDGTYNGVLCPQGAYAYRVKFIGGSIHNWQVKSGTVTIIR